MIETVNWCAGIRDYALTSALRDHRFAPVSAKEVAALRCTVSLLCCFERASRWDDWQVRTLPQALIDLWNALCGATVCLLLALRQRAGICDSPRQSYTRCSIMSWGRSAFAELNALMHTENGPLLARCTMRKHLDMLPNMTRNADTPLLRLQIGVHGLIINFFDHESRVARNATFLPEVADHEARCSFAFNKCCPRLTLFPFAGGSAKAACVQFFGGQRRCGLSGADAWTPKPDRSHTGTRCDWKGVGAPTREQSAPSLICRRACTLPVVRNTHRLPLARHAGGKCVGLVRILLLVLDTTWRHDRAGHTNRQWTP